MRVRTMTATVVLVALAVLSGVGTASARPFDDGDDTGVTTPTTTNAPTPSTGRHAPSSAGTASPTAPSQGPDRRQPSIKAMVKGFARPGEVVRVATYCVSDPAALAASGPFRLENAKPGFGSFVTNGQVSRDAREGTVRVDLVCGRTTVSDSFQVRGLATPAR